MPSPYQLDLTASQINTALNNAWDSDQQPALGQANLVNSDKIYEFVTGYLSTVPLATEFESAEFDIPANDTLATVAHGFGVVPKLFKVVVVCKQSEYGWNVGDEADLYSANGNNLLSTWADATNISFQKDDNIYLVQRDGTGGLFIIDESPAYWRLKARAWV